MLALFCALGLLTVLTPALVKSYPDRARWLALVPLLSGLWVVRLASSNNRFYDLPWAPAFGARFSFCLDGLGMLFTALICVIGALVFLYASAYLPADSRFGRFFAYLLLFFASMLGLVLADNIILLFVFWELTSLSSFFLIGHDHERASARHAALQALLVTGLGGLALLAGLLLLALAGSSTELSALLASRDSLARHPLFPAAFVLVLLGAMAKSAQFPFHFWLPSAMEAPTPVSAYLHSATMVKAGVYLLARLSPLAPTTRLWSAAAVIGLITMVAGFLMALPQRDAKRLLAYTTVGSLGMFTMLLGIGTPMAFHAAMAALVAHALYKAALFLFAGAFEHATGTRDIYQWHGLWRSMPLPAMSALLAGASFAGLPPLLGFVSKEATLGAGWEAPFSPPLVVVSLFIAGIVSVGLFGILVIRPFLGDAHTVHSPGTWLWAPPALLSFAGLAFGLLPSALDRWLVQPAMAARSAEGSTVHLVLWHGLDRTSLLSLGILIAGALAYLRWGSLLRLSARFRGLSQVGPVKGYQLALEASFHWARVQTKALQSGKLRNYMTIILLAAILLSFHALFRNPNLTLPWAWSDLRLHEWIIALLMIVASIAAVTFQSRLPAVAALGVVGLGISLLFLMFGAPDLAMTQFVVESLTVILLVLVLYHLPRFATLSSRKARMRDLIVASLAGALLTVSLIALDAPSRQSTLAPFFAENSYLEAHGRNIVNVILVDFRGLDTMGEITVLGVAAVGVYALLRLKPRRGGEN